MSSARLAGWGGVLFVLLSGAILVLAPFWPPLGVGPTEVAEWYRSHRTPFLIGNWLAIAAAVPSFLQLGLLAARIRRAEAGLPGGEEPWRWIVVLSAGILAHAVGALALIVYQAVPFLLAPGLEGVAKGMSDLAGVAFAAFFLPALAFVLACSWAVYVTGCLPRWYAHAGLPVAALCGVASLGAIVQSPPLGGGGLVTCAAAGLFFTWCLALAGLYLREPAPAA